MYVYHNLAWPRLYERRVRWTDVDGLVSIAGTLHASIIYLAESLVGGVVCNLLRRGCCLIVVWVAVFYQRLRLLIGYLRRRSSFNRTYIDTASTPESTYELARAVVF